MKLTVKSIKTEKVIETKLVELTAWRSLREEKFDRKSQVININALQETYPHLAVLETVLFCNGNIVMVPGQDVYHVIRPLGYIAADKKCLLSQFAGQ